jgi:hypothetical protein
MDLVFYRGLTKEDKIGEVLLAEDGTFIGEMNKDYKFLDVLGMLTKTDQPAAFAIILLPK